MSVSDVKEEFDAANGLYFEVSAPTDSVSDNGTTRDLEINAYVNLLMQCPKAMIKASSGSVTIAPFADAAGANAPYEVTMDQNSGEYELPSSKAANLTCG